MYSSHTASTSTLPEFIKFILKKRNMENAAEYEYVYCDFFSPFFPFLSFFFNKTLWQAGLPLEYTMFVVRRQLSEPL